MTADLSGTWFFLIGAQRSGSTLLRQALTSHPDVLMNVPPRPEPKHFLHAGSEHTSVDEYLRTYFDERPALARGEKSTTYIERPDAANRILRVFPAARFLVLLRDPVERAISNYRFSRDHGLEDRPIREALDPAGASRSWDPSVTSTSPFAYVERGMYADQLDRWVEVVGSDCLQPLVFEELIASPRRVLARVQTFLDIPHRDLILPSPVNASITDVPEGALVGVRRRLAIHYAEPTRRLRDSFGVDVSRWQPARGEDHGAECG